MQLSLFLVSRLITCASAINNNFQAFNLKHQEMKIITLQLHLKCVVLTLNHKILSVEG